MQAKKTHIINSYNNTIEELNYFLETREEYQKLNLSFLDDISLLNDNNLSKIYKVSIAPPVSPTKISLEEKPIVATLISNTNTIKSHVFLTNVAKGLKFNLPTNIASKINPK